MKLVVSLFRGTVILMPREPYPMSQSRKSMLARRGVPSKRWGLIVVFLFLSNKFGMSQESTYTLPRDPKAEIVVYDEQVGFGLPRQNPGAVLTRVKVRCVNFLLTRFLDLTTWFLDAATGTSHRRFLGEGFASLWIDKFTVRCPHSRFLRRFDCLGWFDNVISGLTCLTFETLE